MEYQTVHSFKKNESEEIRIAVREYKDKVYLDARIWFKTKDSEELKPSKKGLMLNAAFVSELRKGFEKAEEVMLAAQA